MDPRLLKSFRQVRKQQPELFTNISVVGQEKAYMNEIVCDRHSTLIEEEVGPCVHQVDMFSGELTEHMENMNFLRGQVKTVIGPKQTSKLQVTDICFSVLGKHASNECKLGQRRAQRKKARQEGVAAKLEAGAFEVMEQVNAMHNACVKAAEEGKVEASFRKAGWLALEPGREGLRKAEGPRWSGLPLGGSNLPQSYLDVRFTGMDEDGKPMKPDWNKLHLLRKKQQEKKQLDTAGKREGGQKAVQQSLSPESALNKKFTAAEAEAEQVEAQIKEFDEKDVATGFLMEYLEQLDIEDDYDTGDAEEKRITIELSDVQELEARENSAWLRLPPKRRRAVLEEGRAFLTTSQVPRILTAESKAEKKVHQTIKRASKQLVNTRK